MGKESESLITVNKKKYEKLKLERDAAVEGFRGQFELAAEAIKQNNELREKVRKLEEVLLKTKQKTTKKITELENQLTIEDFGI